MLDDYDSNPDYSPRKSSIYKQKAMKYQKIENRQIIYECQPLVSKHSVCNCHCLNFVKQTYQNQLIKNRISRVEPLPLSYQIQIEVNHFLQQIINQIKEQIIQKAYQFNSTLERENNITPNTWLQKLHNSSNYRCIHSICQIKQINQLDKSKEEIVLTGKERDWLKQQAQKESNSILFNAQSFRKAFLIKFPEQTISIHQFRKILHQCQIRYRIPSLKPLQFFEKNGKKEEIQQFVSILCSYLNDDYKIIFVDECSLGNISKCSHKQWHILGSFKQTTHRISSFKYLIGAIGSNGFLQFQLFEGTGKAYIFYDFVASIIQKAQEYYQQFKFVLVMDNCSIHKSRQMKKIFSKFPCVFTPAYRPEFNAIEHMFGWIKRKLVINQPCITRQFIYQIHRIINEIDDKMIDEWCFSIYKPLLKEVDFIE